MSAMVGPHRHPTAMRTDSLDSALNGAPVKNADNSLCGYHLHQNKLGEGGFGKVRLATHLLTNMKVAIKMMNKAKLAHDLPRVYTEIEALKVLRHENIAKLLQVVETATDIYLVLEYCSQGELFDYLVNKRRLSETETKVIMRDLAFALSYMHSKGFAHRDLKPENILLDSNHKIKLIDFGLAANGNERAAALNCLATCCGSPAYAAPELLAGPQYCGKTADVWSAGILLYALLVGCLPFEDDNLSALYKKIQSGIYRIPYRISSDARDLITRMLKTNPSERITIGQILRHPWLELSEDMLKTSKQMVTQNIDESVVFECRRLFPKVPTRELRLNIVNGFGYKTATYCLLKMKNKSLSTAILWPFKSPDPKKCNRRRSRSCGNLNNENDLPPKSVAAKPMSPLAQLPVTSIRSPLSPDVKNRARIPVAIASPRPPRETLKSKAIQSPHNSPIVPHKRTRFNDDMGVGTKSPFRGKQLYSPKLAMTPNNAKIEATPKKSLLKKFLETATPAKSQNPRTVTTSSASKNITLTKFTDPQMCIDKLTQSLVQKGYQCKQKDFTLRCVMSTSNQIMLSFNLEICKFNSYCVIQRKRLRGDAWMYKKVCEEILQFCNE